MNSKRTSKDVIWARSLLFSLSAVLVLIVISVLFAIYTPNWPPGRTEINVHLAGPIIDAGNLSPENGYFYLLSIPAQLEESELFDDVVASAFQNSVMHSRGDNSNVWSEALRQAPEIPNQDLFSLLSQAAKSSEWIAPTNMDRRSLNELLHIVQYLVVMRLAYIESDMGSMQGAELYAVFSELITISCRLRDGGDMLHYWASTSLLELVLWRFRFLMGTSMLSKELCCSVIDVLNQESIKMSRQVDCFRSSLRQYFSDLPCLGYGSRWDEVLQDASDRSFIYRLPFSLYTFMGSNIDVTTAHLEDYFSHHVYSLENNVPVTDEVNKFTLRLHHDSIARLGRDPIGRILLIESGHTSGHDFRRSLAEMDRIRSVAVLFAIVSCWDSAGSIPPDLKNLEVSHLECLGNDLELNTLNLQYLHGINNGFRLYGAGVDRVDHGGVSRLDEVFWEGTLRMSEEP